MTYLIVAATALLAAAVLRRTLRTYLAEWFTRRAQEQALGLPRGSLREQWQHPPDCYDDDEWVELLQRLNSAAGRERTLLGESSD